MNTWLCVTVGLLASGALLLGCGERFESEPPTGGAGGQGGQAGSGGTSNLLPDGSPCTTGAECSSGECVDGLCCESACDDTCFVCDRAGFEGACRPAEAGTDAQGECAPGVCDGNGACARGDPLWSKTFGDGGFQIARGVAVDSDGDIIIVGYFTSQVDFGGGPHLSPAAERQAFVAKFAPDGTLLWATSFGEGDGDEAHAVGVDANDAIYVTGTYTDVLDIGGHLAPLTGTTPGGFIAKFTPGGAVEWLNGFGNELSFQNSRSIAVESTGRSWITGFFQGDFMIDTHIVQHSGMDDDIFVARFGAAGVVQWSHAFGGAGQQRGYSVAVDDSGDVLLAGEYTGNVTFGGQPLPAGNGGMELFVAKLNTQGQHLWSHGFGGPQDDQALSVAFDQGGGALLFGGFRQTIDFNNGALAGVGESDLFLARFDVNGSTLWSRAFGSTGADSALAVHCDAANAILVTGEHTGTIDFGGGPLTDPGQGNVFLAKFAVDGLHFWSKSFGDGSRQAGFDVATDADGSVVAVGRHFGAIDFGGGPLSDPGEGNAFLAKFGP